MASEKWEIDLSHSTIDFWVRHMVIAKVRGQFTKWNGTIEIDAQSPDNSKAQISIDAASIDTREAQRDGHLKSADFFDVEKFPTIAFMSKSIEKTGGTYQVTGDLTIRGVTHSVVVAVEDGGRGKDPWGGERAAFTAKAKIDRKEFGLMWNQALEAGGFLVGDSIEIVVEIEAKKV